MKFYAVKQGRTTGIFTSWDECKRQVDGYSGAVYKSFPTEREAHNFLGQSVKTDTPVVGLIRDVIEPPSYTVPSIYSSEPVRPVPSVSHIVDRRGPISSHLNDSDKFVIYTDGGHNKFTGEVAFGSVVDAHGRDLIEDNRYLLEDMELRPVMLPVGLRTVIISYFNDVVSQQNNGAELLALIAGLRIGIMNNVDIIYSDSDLLIKYWSVSLNSNKRLTMDPRKVMYIDQLIALRKQFKGDIVKISGDDNLADLGFHH